MTFGENGWLAIECLSPAPNEKRDDDNGGIICTNKCPPGRSSWWPTNGRSRGGTVLLLLLTDTRRWEELRPLVIPYISTPAGIHTGRTPTHALDKYMQTIWWRQRLQFTVQLGVFVGGQRVSLVEMRGLALEELVRLVSAVQRRVVGIRK